MEHKTLMRKTKERLIEMLCGSWGIILTPDSVVNNAHLLTKCELSRLLSDITASEECKEMNRMAWVQSCKVYRALLRDVEARMEFVPWRNSAK